MVTTVMHRTQPHRRGSSHPVMPTCGGRMCDEDLDQACGGGWLVNDPLVKLQLQDKELSFDNNGSMGQEEAEKTTMVATHEGKSTVTTMPKPLPLVAFNHVSREVLDYELTRDFYVNVLGFKQVARPEFEVEGVWLWGFGLSLHLIQTHKPQHRNLLKAHRFEHYMDVAPSIDHIAFITSDLLEVERQLQLHNVLYKRSDSPKIGIYQLLILDPDHNVIEISNCAPAVGETTCSAPLRPPTRAISPTPSRQAIQNSNNHPQHNNYGDGRL